VGALPAPLYASLHEPGALISKAVVADVTADGLSAVGDFVPALVPESIEIPDTGQDDGWYSYQLSGAWASITVDDVAITPTDGVLYLDAGLTVWLNDASDPFDLEYEVLWVFGDTCHGRVEPFGANVLAAIYLTIVDGKDGMPTLDVTIGSFDVSYDLASEDIVLDDCGIGDLEEVLNWFGLSIYDLVLGYADDAIQDAISDATADLETMIEEAFASATIEETVELTDDASLDILLYPSDIEIATEGLRVVMDGSFDSGAAAECIEDYDPGGSPQTKSQPPAIGEAPTGIADFHAGILASDDALNQAMYAVWRAGLLCYTIDENFETFPMSTSILGLLEGAEGDEGQFDQLFPDPQDMAIITRPVSQPLAALDGAHAVDLEIDELGLDFFADLDHRKALVLGLDMDVTVGADMELDASTGELAAVLDLDPSNFGISVRSAELTPGVEEAIVENFGGLLDTILGAVLGGTLDGLTFSLPALEGLGLTSLEAGTAGSSGDWLGLYAQLGEVSYGGGCSDKKGKKGVVVQISCTGHLGGSATAHPWSRRGP